MKTCHEKLPVLNNLISRQIVDDVPRCKEAAETVLHVFKECKFSKKVWNRWNKHLMWFNDQEMTMAEWVDTARTVMKQDILEETFSILYMGHLELEKQRCHERRKTDRATSP